MIEVSIQGLEQIAAMVDPALFERKLDRAIERAGEAIRDDTKRLPPVSAARTGFAQPGIPVDTGRMRQSIQKRKIALLTVGVFAETNYSLFVHEGTAKMQGRSFFSGMLEDFGGKEKIERIVSDTLSQLFQSA